MRLFSALTQMNTFRGISISHISAPIHVREQIALNQDESKAFMLKLREFFDATELLVVSTCNRTEIYYLAAENINQDVIKLLLIEKGITNTADFIPLFQEFNEQDQAIEHLFEVGAGLHSLVVGDMQIPNQIKHAYQWSADVQMAGPFLHRLMHTIFFTNKKIAQETAFRDGAASTSYAAVELIEEVTALKPNPNILVLGLGEIGADVCKNLKAKNYENVFITNRTYAKANDLSQDTGFEVIDFVDATAAILRADVVLSSISSAEPFITKTLLQKKSSLAFKYLIDLSVPRSVADDVEEIPGVVVYNIDTIQNRANEALNRRLAAMPQVREIIHQAIEEFNNWSQEMIVSPTIQKLKGALEEIRQKEMARFVKQLTADETEKVENITKSMMQKIINLPVLQLKAACKRGEAETLIDVLNDLFNLEKQPTTEPKS